MKKNFKKKALCMALASVMVLGNAQIVMASDAPVTEYSEEQASLASAPKITGMVVNNETNIEGASCGVSVSGIGEKAELLVNGVVFKTVYGDYYTEEWSLNEVFYGVAGGSYKLTLNVYGSDGSKITKELGTKKFVVPAFSKTDYGLSAYASYVTKENGYRKYEGIAVRADLEKYVNVKMRYRLLRSTKPNGPYSVVKGSETETSSGSSLYYKDTSAQLNRTYYYKFQMITGTDDYIKTSRSVRVSPVIVGSSVLENDGSTNLIAGSKGVEIELSGMGSTYNQFDIYRSTSKTKGYRKIKTILGDKYVDTSAKAGTVYYYKVIPKYYDIISGKLVSGAASEPKAVKLELGEVNASAVQVSATAGKVSWDKVRGANIYEVWMLNSSVSGDCYRKVATTKNTSVTLKGLVSGNRYSFLVKAQIKKYGKVISENSDYTNLTVGYEAAVHDMKVLWRTSSVNSAKTSIAVTTAMSWKKVWGATGYKIMAYNRYTNNIDCVATLKSASIVTYKFRNPGSRSKGLKYTSAYVLPYKGSAVGYKEENGINVNMMPVAKNIKVKRLSNSQAKITWSPVAGANSYTVERIMDNGYTTSAYNIEGTSYVDSNLSTSTVYTYRVCAYTSDFDGFNNYLARTDSEIGRTGSARYVHKVGTPKIAGASNSASNTVTLTWKKISLAKYYIVYRSTQKNGTYSKIGSTVKLTYADKKAVKGKTYYYKVKAVAIGDNGIVSTSAASPVASVKCTK